MPHFFRPARSLVEGPVEYFMAISHKCSRTVTDISERECSKKFVQQGRSRFDARSVLPVRERERSEERQVCEPEGQVKGRRCLCEPLGQSQRTPLAAFFNIPLKDFQLPGKNSTNSMPHYRTSIEDEPWQNVFTRARVNRMPAL